MVTPRKENTKEPEPQRTSEDDDDNQSQETVPRGRTRDTYESELVEIFLRVEITPNKRDERGPNLCHATVLKEMYNSFPEDELQIINNRNKQIQPYDYRKWSKSEYYKKHFDTHTIKGKGGSPDRYYVIHRIRTTLSLAIIRHDRRVLQALQENNVFLRRHFFQEDEWNTVNLGFILFLDPSKHLRDEAKERILNIAIDENCYERGKGDKFQLVAGTPFLYTAGRRYPTQAYTVVCLRENAGDVDTMMKNIFRKSSHYVKFRLRTQNAQAFGKALQAQNQYLASLRTIPIVGITNDMMQELEGKILEVEGVSEVLRSHKTEATGRWNIITYEDIFYRALKDVKKNLPGWLEETFQGTYDRPDDFPPISVTARVADDDSSVGDCSYLSTSAISYGSFQTTGSNDLYQENTTPHHENTKEYRRPTSYADATKNAQRNQPTPRTFIPVHQSSVSAMSSPATIPIDVQQKIQIMEEKLAHYQGLEEKVDRLTKILEALLSTGSPPKMVFAAPTVLSQEQERHNLSTQQTSETPMEEEPTMAQPPLQIPKLPSFSGRKRPPPPPPKIPPPPPIQTRSNGTKKGDIEQFDPPSPPSEESTTRLGSATRLFPETTMETTDVTIFDDWKKVESRGKRNADNSNIVHQKKLDKKVTPTKIKGGKEKLLRRQKLPIKEQKPLDSRERLYLDNGDGSKFFVGYGPDPTLSPLRPSKVTDIQLHIPTIKQDAHDAVRANRPQTWQQRLNLVPPSDKDEEMQDTGNDNPLAPSDDKKLPAEEAKPGF